MTRGPAPTPTAILEGRGSWRADKNKLEPMPERITPDMPNYLCDVAADVWQHTVPILERMGVLTEADGRALERYCVIFAQWRKVSERLKLMDGFTIAIKKKNKDPENKDPKKEYLIVDFKEVPELKQARQLSTQLTQLESLFGLNPSSRARIVVNPEGERGYLDGAGKVHSSTDEQFKRLGIPIT